MKIRWSFLFFGSFAPHFQIKLSTHGSNLNSIFVIMSELKFFLLTGILTQNFNTMDLVKFLEKNKKLQIQIIMVTLKVASNRTMSKNKKWKKVKNQDSMGKTNFFLSTCPSALGQFQPYGCMWELLRNTGKMSLILVFNQKFTTGSYRVGIGRAWCSRKACELCSSLV
jgi:hypothetical protein